MKNFKNILFGLLFLISFGSFAQQGIMMMPLEQDSSQIELNKQIEQQVYYQKKLYFRDSISRRNTHNDTP